LIETINTQCKRWEADIDTLQYLISKVLWARSEEDPIDILREMRAKCERLSIEIGEFIERHKEGNRDSKDEIST
jgi:hypothetical protein